MTMRYYNMRCDMRPPAIDLSRLTESGFMKILILIRDCLDKVYRFSTPTHMNVTSVSYRINWDHSSFIMWMQLLWQIKGVMRK